jgi:hypothetical protein
VLATGLLAGAVVLASSRRLLTAMSVTLEMWTASSLLRLTADATWGAIAIAATLVALRRVLAVSLRSYVTARHSDRLV